MSAEVLGQFLDRHLVRARPRDRPGPDRPARAEPAPLKQAPDHRCVEGRLLGRAPTLGIQAIGDGLRRRARFAQRGDARDQPVPLLQLLEASYRADLDLLRKSGELFS
jgi:hypothetical protein